MEFIDRLWDETFAGPKHNSISRENITVSVSRTITIHLTNTFFPKVSRDDDFGGESNLIAPTGSITPDSPFSHEELKRLGRKKGEGFERAEPRSPTVYDWIVISALDR